MVSIWRYGNSGSPSFHVPEQELFCGVRFDGNSFCHDRVYEHAYQKTGSRSRTENNSIVSLLRADRMRCPVPHGVAVGYGIIDWSRCVQFTYDHTRQEHRPNDRTGDVYHATLSHLIVENGCTCR